MVSGVPTPTWLALTPTGCIVVIFEVGFPRTQAKNVHFSVVIAVLLKQFLKVIVNVRGSELRSQPMLKENFVCGVSGLSLNWFFEHWNFGALHFVYKTPWPFTRFPSISWGLPGLYFISWETEATRDSPKISATFRCQIPRDPRLMWGNDSHKFCGEQAKSFICCLLLVVFRYTPICFDVFRFVQLEEGKRPPPPRQDSAAGLY